MIHVTATLKAREGMRAKLVDAFRPCLASSNEEPGCISYSLAVDVADPDRVHFIGQWESREVLEKHFHTAHLTQALEAGRPFVDSGEGYAIYPEKIERLG